jgi:hypothetical protein
MAAQNLRPKEQSMVAGLPKLLTLRIAILFNRVASYLTIKKKEVLVDAEHPRVG